jgi:hypothetical protein
MPNSPRKVMSHQETLTLPKLRVPQSQARQKLEAHIAIGQEILTRQTSYTADIDKVFAESETWREFAIRLLASLFNITTIANEFSDKSRKTFIYMGSAPYTQKREDFTQLMTSRIRALSSILESLELYEEDAPIVFRQQESMPKDPQAEAFEKIELIASRFHTVARQLLQRRHDHNIPRDTLKITDEYEVQDLFHALLRLFFDDVRNEEWAPNYAGGSSRIDFLLKQEQVLVEIKMTRPGLTKVKDVSDQLIIDSVRYQVHQDCKMLVAFVYDPQEHLNNPSGIERDLTKTINNVPIKVIIRSR